MIGFVTHLPKKQYGNCSERLRAIISGFNRDNILEYTQGVTYNISYLLLLRLYSSLNKGKKLQKVNGSKSGVDPLKLFWNVSRSGSSHNYLVYLVNRRTLHRKGYR